MGCVPFSDETNLPLLPCSVMVPSALVPQVNFSQSPAVVRLQVIACVPFSLDTNLPWLFSSILPPPPSTTRNCSQACAVGRIQIIACVPFSPLTYSLLKTFSVMDWPIGAPPPPDAAE